MPIKRSLSSLLETKHFDESRAKMAFVVGPRQSGKTTLAKALQKERGSEGLYRNWDDLAWRRETALKPYGFLEEFRPESKRKPLVVLDEIHKFPRWKQYVKGLWDTRSEETDFLITGSGRLDIYRRGGDSLLGRYHQYRLHPLSVSEVLEKPFNPDEDTPGSILKKILAVGGKVDAETKEVFEGLLHFGGFPEPFLRQSRRQHRLWLRERRERLVREDLRDLTRIQLLSSVEQMVELLAPRVGSLLSLNNLRGDLGVSMEAVRLWIEQLERLYWCYRVRPYAGKLSRTLRREPKLYLYDWSELQEESQKLENMIASALLRWCHFTQDWGQETLELRFIRDKEKREVDFFLIKEGQPFLLIEVKLSDTNPTKVFEHFCDKFRSSSKVLLVGKLDHSGKAKGIPVLPAAWFLAQIP